MSSYIYILPIIVWINKNEVAFQILMVESELQLIIILSSELMPISFISLLWP